MAIDPKKLLPPGRADTPEGNVDREGDYSGYVTEKQYNSLNKNILAIRRNLGAIADLLIKRGQQDAVEDNQEIQKKRKEIDRTAKGAEENFVESSIKQALIKPVKALGNKIRGPFDGFMKALESLFMGWLGLKGIDALEAWQNGDTEALEQIKNDLIKGLAVAAGIGIVLNGGIGLVTGAISGIVTSLIGSLPGLIALMANPWVWLGAAAVYGGIKLLQILNDSGASGLGRGSYGQYKQQVIDMVATQGKDAAYKELEKRRNQLLARNPWLAALGHLNPARAFSKQGALLNEIEQNMEFIQKGYYDRFTVESLSSADKKRMNQIVAELGVLRSVTDQFNATKSEMEKVLGNKTVDQLTPEEKSKYDALKRNAEGLQSMMLAGMKKYNDIRDSLSNPAAKDFLDARVSRVNPVMFDKKVDVEIGPIDIGVGDPDPNRLERLGEIQNYLNQGLKNKPDPEQARQLSSTQLDNASTVASAISDTRQLTKKVNINVSNNLSAAVNEMPAFTFMPYSSAGREALEPVATAAVGTGYPTNFLTQNPYNAKNLIFSASVFETS